MAHVPPVQRAAEDLCAQVPDAVAHFRLCGGEDCLWLPSEADVTGGKRALMWHAKIPRLRGPWEPFMHP